MPRSVTPLVSVVIVTHGGGELLTDCIETLRRNTREHLEVIVLDSASPDGTGEWARRALPGVKVHSSPKNHGFGAMSNAGVLDARAPYVCFLNADVTVEPNWLPPLLEVLETQPHVGAVAPLMLNPDRSVQECGSIVWADGWAQAWTGDELGERAALSRRQVDYASGACLLVRRNAFREAGGFAPEYHIAYFEDADLAFAMREAGWVTMVEPRSVVLHQRHGVSGSQRARELMERNHGIFAAKWARRLSERVPSGDPRPYHFAHARDVTVTERILVIDDGVPNADLGIGDPRTHRLLDAVRSPDRMVTFLAREPSRDDGRWLLERNICEHGIEVVAGAADIFEWMGNRLGCYDVVIVSRPGNWEWAARAIELCQPQAVRVYNSPTLTGRQKQPAGPAHLRLESERIGKLESSAFVWADVALCATRDDLDWVAATIAPGTHMYVVSHSAAASVRGFEERSGVAFFGDFTPQGANEAAVLDLALEVWPTLRKRGLKLSIVGSEPTRAVQALADSQIDVVGRVPNLSWWRSRALLHIAPFRSEFGLRPTLIESMAAGLPFLTTPLGAEGLYLGSLAEHLVSTSSAELLEQADRLLSDSSLWIDVQDQLLDVAGAHFSDAAFRRSVDDALLACGLAPSSAPVRATYR
jgi:GT2 family glycosyltransferase